MNDRISPIWLLVGGLICIFLLNSCDEREEVTLQRLDQQLFSGKSRDSIRAFLNQHPDVARLYFSSKEPGNDTALVNELYNRINDRELNVLYQQVQTEFSEAKELENQLSEAFTNIKKEFPDFRIPRVTSLVTGFMGPDFVVSDSLIVIGLDYFAGPESKYRPQGPEFPQYILRRYQKDYLVPAIVFAISDRFNATDRSDQTLLADMVYYGKGFVFTKAMLPEVADSLIIGYTDQQLTQTYAAQDLVWAHFIDEQLLYQTSPAIKQRYTNERPFTAEIGSKAPGAIGRWLGWRIVGKYHDENPSVSIRELMANTNARQIFQESGYKGQPDEE
ncbi:gliding motility protein [Nibrella saemangeumensis]